MLRTGLDTRSRHKLRAVKCDALGGVAARLGPVPGISPFRERAFTGGRLLDADLACVSIHAAAAARTLQLQPVFAKRIMQKDERPTGLG